MSPLKREKSNRIELDKSSEVKLDYEDQPWFSIQIPSALMYLLFGLYEKYKPAGTGRTHHINFIGRMYDFKGIASIQCLCTLIMNRSVAP